MVNGWDLPRTEAKEDLGRAVRRKTLCDQPGPFAGADWGMTAPSTFATQQGAGLWRYRLRWTPKLVTTLDKKSGELSHKWPHVLPGGGRSVLRWEGPNPRDFQ